MLSLNHYTQLFIKLIIQNFAKSLLDVADNLGRASSVVKDSFSKLDASKEAGGAAPLLKTLLEGVDMTEKQLAEVSFLYYDTSFFQSFMPRPLHVLFYGIIFSEYTFYWKLHMQVVF